MSQSIPGLDKMLLLSDFFKVSTNTLLKDELELDEETDLIEENSIKN